MVLTVKTTGQVIKRKIYRLAQTPKMRMNIIKNRANGFRIRTRNFDNRGAKRAINKPIESGITKQNA